MIKTSIAVLALLTATITPAFAQMNSGAMGTGNAGGMKNDSAMKPMSKADKATMAKCEKMSPAMMKKSAKCTKMMSMHQGPR